MTKEEKREEKIKKIIELEAVKKELTSRHYLKDLYEFNTEILQVEGEKKDSPLAPFHKEMCDFVMSPTSKKKLMLVPRGHLKALKTKGTNVLTPEGYKPYADLKEGNEVIGGDGLPTKVTKVHPKSKMELYEVTTNDGRNIVCNKEHRFRVRIRANDKKWKVRTLEWIIKRYSKERFDKRNGETYFEHPVQLKPIKVHFEEKELPIDPYTLGMWLGDGHSSGSRVASADPEEFEYSSFKWHKVAGKYNYDTHGLHKLLRENNLLKNKHIPSEYFVAGDEQRLKLLAGLMDTDGTCHKDGGIAYFSNTNYRLIKDFVSLVRSLGGVAMVCKVNQEVNGEPYDTWTVSVKLPDDINPFNLKRKAKMFTGLKRELTINIVDIERVENDVANCITVEAEDGMFITDDYFPTHNSTIVTVGYSLLRIAQDPSVRILIANATYDMACSFLGQIKKHLQNNEVFKDYYGDLASNADRWSENMISVPKNVPFRKKEATVTAYGVGGNLVSQHYDCLLPGTEVLTSNGFKRVERIKKGSRVFSSDGKFHSVIATQKKRTDRSVVRISPAYQAKEVEVTFDHKVYVWRNNSFQWVEAKDLNKKRDMLVIPRASARNGAVSRTNKRLNKLARTKDIWRLIGYWLAEGCRTPDGGQIRLTFSNKEKGLAEDVKRIVKKHLGVKVSIRPTKNSTLMVLFSDNDMKELLGKFGDRATNKHLPGFALNTSTVRQVELVKGYFAGDGSKTNETVCFSSASYSLLSGIQLLLAKMGIASGISQNRYAGKSTILGNIVNIQDGWNLTSTSSDLKLMLGFSARMAVRPIRSWFSKDYWVVPIRELAYISRWDGFVYDIQVGGKHDFYCPGMIVHNCIIMDDVVNRDFINTEEQIQKTILFYKDALDLLETDGKIIIVGTRWADGDLYGWIMDKSSPEKIYEDFDIMIKQAYTGNLETGDDLKLLFPEKFTGEVLKGLKKQKGPIEFANQYMNDPMPVEEAKFKPQWFKQVLEDELKWREINYYTMVDPAIGQLKSSDKTAIITIGVDQFNNWFVVNIIWDHLLPNEIIEHIFANWERFQPRKIGVEMTAYQKSLQYAIVDEMRRRNIFLPIVELKADRAKEERIEGLVPRYANGSIYHLTQCPFREAMEDELLRFPRGRHDDIIDALAYGLQIARQSRAGKPRFTRGSDEFEDRRQKRRYIY